MKDCTQCEETKPFTQFYKDKRTKDGLKSECKACFKKVLVKTRDPEKRKQSNKEADARRRKRDPLKVKARETLRNAVRDGRIEKPSQCVMCSTVGPVEGHHTDYSKPLDVEWLCQRCHDVEGETMLVIIAGSRHFDDLQVLEDAVEDSGFNITCVVSGAAKGVDLLGERWAQARGIGIRSFPADWDRYKRGAGPIRNEEMAKVAGGLIALPCQCSRGTKDMIRRAHNHDLQVHVVDVDCGR